MNIIATIALLTWIPCVLALMSAMPTRRAVICAAIAAWLFLPKGGFPLPGLPDYTKVTATTIGMTLGLALFDPGRLTRLRPRWFDLPMATWCLVPMASSLSNGLGAYDGLSTVVDQFLTWGLPYLIGRACVADLDGLRELGIGIVIGGLAYVPLCLIEVRISPQFHRVLYGFHPHDFSQTMRYGGYRPTVFMAHGLEVGMWMATAAMVGWWLWSTGALRRVVGLPMGAAAVALLVTTVLCKSTGAVMLMAVGMATLWLSVRVRRAPVVWALILAAPVYMTARASGSFSGDRLVDWTRSALGEDRAGSVSTRVMSEDVLVAHALQRPAFGWGRWRRNLVFDEDGRLSAIPDGLWVNAIGQHGLVGLIGLCTSILLPTALLTARHPVRTWRDPAVAPAAVLGVTMALFMLDCVANAMFNPVYLLVIGGLAGLPAGVRTDLGGAVRARLEGLERARPAESEPDWALAVAELEGVAAGRPDDAEALRDLARAWGGYGRCLAALGRSAEAVEARGRAVEILSALTEPECGDPAAAQDLSDALNDLAWLLAEGPDPAALDPDRAVPLAEGAVEMDPSRSAYWNTLGAARLRSGDARGAIAALERSTALGEGGGAFDHLLLALAYRHLGEEDRARGHIRLADARIGDIAPGHPVLDRLRAEAAGRVRSGAAEGPGVRPGGAGHGHGGASS